MRNPIRSEPLRAPPSRSSFTAFRSLALEMGKTVEGLAPAQGYPAVTPLFSQGAPAQDVYFLARGLVKLIGLEANGQETVPRRADRSESTRGFLIRFGTHPQRKARAPQ